MFFLRVHGYDFAYFLFLFCKTAHGERGAYGEGVRIGFHRAKHWQKCLNTWSRQGFQATDSFVYVCLLGHVLLFRWTYEGVPVWQSKGLKLHAEIDCTSGTGSVAYGLRKGSLFPASTTCLFHRLH